MEFLERARRAAAPCCNAGTRNDPETARFAVRWIAKKALGDMRQVKTQHLS
jgi:hypothetical protein